jgi:hypothetical protein
MGTWGAAIFDNDVSADVRDVYVDAVREDPGTASARTVRRFATDVEHPDTASDVWLALAATQWEVGHPDPDVIARAFTIIDNDSDIDRLRDLGADAEFLTERRAVLDELRTTLLAHHPRRARPAPAPAYEGRSTSLTIGDVVGYTLRSGRILPLLTAQVTRTFVASAPVFLLVPPVAQVVPTLEELRVRTVALDLQPSGHALLYPWASVSPEDGRPDRFLEVPAGVTARAAALWVKHESEADEAHELERTRIIGHLDWSTPVSAAVYRLGWSCLDALLAEQFDIA